MRTKLILGLTVGLMTAAQISNAQGIFTSMAGDATLGNPMAASYVEVSTVPADNAATPDAVAGDAATSSTDLFSNSSNDKNFSSGTADGALLNFADATLQQDLTATTTDAQDRAASQAAGNGVVKRQSSDANGAINWAADGNWLTFGTATGLAATSHEGALPQLADNNDTATLATSLDPNNFPAMAGDKALQGGLPVPLIGPEPSTVELLVLGGSALASGALSRRKQTA